MQKGPSAQKLQKILETTNERDLFLVGHMYIETTIDRILEKKFNIPPKSIDSTSVSYTHLTLPTIYSV